MQLFKFLGFLLILPIVMGVTKSFGHQLDVVAAKYPEIDLFKFGMLMFVLIHIFLKPTMDKMYHWGQQTVSYPLRFLPQAEKIIHCICPFYVWIFMVVFGVNRVIFQYPVVDYSCLIIVGFGLAMHLVYVSSELSDDRSRITDGHYLFYLSLVYIGNLALLGFLFTIAFQGFSLGSFIRIAARTASEIYGQVWGMWFMAK